MPHSSRLLFAATLALASVAAFAAPAASKPLSASQQRMSDCSKEATGKKGDARKTFMSSCLKG